MDEQENARLGKTYQVGGALDDLSLGELSKTIKILHQEISRLESEIAKKQKSLMQAEGAFKI